MTTHGMRKSRPANLDIPVIGQKTPAELAFGNAFETSSLEVVGFDAQLGRWTFRQ
jgi:hypothetical protein